MPHSYVLITPAKNEAAHIEKTIVSMVHQILPPSRWVIVSDGSTDGTNEIVERYLEAHPWIELIKAPEHSSRCFASKVRSFNLGLERVRDKDYDFVGCVDGDVSFEPGYFMFLISRMQEDPRLGVAGTHYTEEDGFHSFRDSKMSVKHVNGQIQLFRKECFQDIGGYVPIPGGGIDWVAVTTARMRGWKTRSFGEMTFQHHRPMGTAGASRLGACYRQGRKDYALGGHILWQILRALFQMSKKPYVLGGVLTFVGYASGWLTVRRRAVSKELMHFHRREQMDRLRQMLCQRQRT